MARASLLTTSDPWFNFEHAMAHREALAVIGFQPGFTPQTGSTAQPFPPRSPLSRYSVIPYFIEPEQNVDRRAGKWHLNHQQAHNDALQNVPSKYFWQYTTTTVPQPPPNPPLTFQTPQTVVYGLRIGGNLIDTSFADEQQLRWWEFQNHMEHFVGSTSIAPSPAPKPAPQATFPFW